MDTQPDKPFTDEEFIADPTQWTDTFFDEFEKEFASKYPELAGDLVYDKESGQWVVKARVPGQKPADKGQLGYV